MYYEPTPPTHDELLAHFTEMEATRKLAAMQPMPRALKFITLLFIDAVVAVFLVLCYLLMCQNPIFGVPQW